MKFLVVTRNKESYYALPVEKRLENRDKGAAFFKKYLKTGKCKDLYYHADIRGTVSIWDVKSAEEIVELMLEVPGRDFGNFDVQPLVEPDAALKGAKQYLTKLLKK